MIVLDSRNFMVMLTLLHPEQPKLCGVLAVLSAVRLNNLMQYVFAFNITKKKKKICFFCNNCVERTCSKCV